MGGSSDVIGDLIKVLKMEPGEGPTDSSVQGISRRSFIGRIGMASVAAGVLGPASTALTDSGAPAIPVGLSAPSFSTRLSQSLVLRISRTVFESEVPVPPHTTNGDEQRYFDKCASFSKCLLQDAIAIVNKAYFTGLLVLLTLNAPVNPGNPYVNSRTQNGFCTFGTPDFAAAMSLVAARALQRVWYQKWLIHLIHRPEAGGGVPHENLTGDPTGVEAQLASNVLDSQAVAQTFSQYGTYLLPQAFPEGSPSHPSYPTGHGIVGGACITMLKFFFDESYVIPNPLVPSSDGTSLLSYTGSGAGQITVGGELNKLARNVLFGHGVHADIHWRTDSDYSMLLGEAMAISYLNDLAQTYHEKFSITFTKLDGNPVTISNE
jgi:hypothetical protein